MSKKFKIPTRTNIKGTDWNWVIKIFFITFALSLAMSTGANEALSGVNVFFAFLILLFLISLGAIFDMIGMAVASADETPFHSMASHGVKSANRAIWLVRNAEKVSNFCNDVVGDIMGILSGSVAGIIVLNLSNEGSLWLSVLMTGIVSALTVGVKAAGKGISISKSNLFVYCFAVIIDFFWFTRNKKGKKK
ncbi:MAG: hypothetical protein PHE51_02885 [Eubacteriales bacterium]|nr:hypothetical protein [Eubacteriales bacterium]